MTEVEATLLEAKKYSITIAGAARHAGKARRSFYNAIEQGRTDRESMKPAERMIFDAIKDLIAKQKRYYARIKRVYGNRQQTI